MPSQGPNSGGTFADDSSIGTIAWSNVNNAASSNDVYAVASAPSIIDTHYLKATNFGFSIPSGATISGIEVRIERSMSVSGFVVDNSMKAVQGGSIVGAEHATNTHTWTTTDTIDTFGGPMDLWGVTWTPDQINASDFGAAFSAFTTDALDMRIDQMTMTVYYSEAGEVPLIMRLRARHV